MRVVNVRPFGLERWWYIAMNAAFACLSAWQHSPYGVAVFAAVAVAFTIRWRLVRARIGVWGMGAFSGASVEDGAQPDSAPLRVEGRK